METLIQADIFFFITSIFVILLTAGFAVALFYVIPILKDMRHLSALAREEGDKLAQDIDALRTAAKEEGTKARSILDYFLTLFIKRRKIVRKKKELK
ncbi:MAG: hypothetical protein NUV61_00545 [Candidatus Azambacteria bacterium]|nr:hypothetical protein [Candidatus Azambacteria bacterium]